MDNIHNVYKLTPEYKVLTKYIPTDISFIVLEYITSIQNNIDTDLKLFRINKKKYGREQNNPNDYKHWKNNKKHGLEILHSYCSTVKYETMWKNGKKHGVQKIYYNNELETKVKWKNNKKQGNTYTYKNSKIESIIPYLHNKKHGIHINYNDEGIIIKELSYKYGFLEGTSKSYYEDGKKKRIGKYKNGFSDGLFIDYSDSGNVENVEKYKNNKFIEKKLYDNNGKITKIIKGEYECCCIGEEIGKCCDKKIKCVSSPENWRYYFKYTPFSYFFK
jgi:antitoxin component YwqK of YwqJK toxin-antitoxin module